MDAEREAELQEMLVKMQKASDRFYTMATQTGCHPFIEFCGFMNEYIQICRAALEEGLDFSESSVHAGGTLPMQEHHAKYIAEKFGCIFGTSFGTNDRLRETFLRGVFGEVVLIPV